MLPGRDQSDASSSNLWRISGLGAELAFGILGMVLMGWLLDRWLGTAPWLLITFTVLGVLGAGYNFIRRAMRLTRSAQEAYRREHPRASPPRPEPPVPTADDLGGPDD